jgi:hypothetical protein
MRSYSTALAAILLLSVIAAAPANAQSIRTFVSTAGSDSNPCSLAAPCRHFSAAVAATAPGGEVDALDAGAYGSFTINQAITIDGQGWSYVAPPNNGNGITIDAGSGNVTIRGVSINGVGTTSTNGIVFNSGGSLTVTDCVARNFQHVAAFTGNGIFIAPTSGVLSFAITNTITSNNGNGGIIYLPPSGSTATATGVIDHVTTTGNGYGILIDTHTGGGGAITIAISNSVASNNGDGIFADNTAALKVTLGSSVITGNSNGIFNSTSPNSFYTYGNNEINLNTATDISGALNASFTLR